MTEFEGWYEREHPLVLAACCALGGNADVAREATDEAFVRALERWSKVGEMAAPGGWVQVVALNRAADTVVVVRYNPQVGSSNDLDLTVATGRSTVQATLGLGTDPGDRRGDPELVAAFPLSRALS
jgi:predicted RNA polymerase sigma factor